MNGRISILLPSRGRPQGLSLAIGSMVSRAVKPELLEFLLRTDDDQPAMLPFVEPFQFGQSVVREYRGPRGRGYRDVYLMYNALAVESVGDIIINWNDDVEMLTQGWDDKLCTAPAHSVQFLRRDIFKHADTTFPCTGRSVYKAMGHLSLQVHADDWMGKVAQAADVAVFRDDIVFHHHRLDDLTSYERDHGGYDIEGFNSPEMVELRLQAAERVRAADPRRKQS